MGMLTDAIAHSILPGIVIAYLISESKNNFIILLVATIFGVLTAFLTTWINRRLPNRGDTATGITFTFLFAVGIILVTLFAEQADIDQECVLFGEMLYIPFDTLDFFPEIPRAFPLGLCVFLCVLIFIKKAYRPLWMITFDENYALSVGISVSLWHYLLVSLVSMVTVASFELVGSVLVVALFVIPPATAYLVSNNLKKMIKLSTVFGLISVILGYYISVIFGGSSAASIVITETLIFLCVLIFSKLTKNNFNYVK
jgi:manganese/zinc/iron transport system permease protein